MSCDEDRPNKGFIEMDAENVSPAIKVEIGESWTLCLQAGSRFNPVS